MTHVCTACGKPMQIRGPHWNKDRKACPGREFAQHETPNLLVKPPPRQIERPTPVKKAA